MGVRDITSSQARVDHIREQGISTGIIHLLPLNLKSLTATKEFADGVKKITNRIDLLINNAGIMMTPFECTEDGFESHFQVNYLSHFLLTLLLLPVLKRTGMEWDRSSRIINTTSAYHHAGSIDFRDLEMRSIYAPPKCYFDSKLCQILFTKQLEKILQQDNAKVHAYAVHPGAIPTELWSQAGGIHKCISCVLKYLLPDAEGGADAIIHAALSNKLENKSGAYLERFKIADTSCEANSVCDQVLLWDRSTYLCKANLGGSLN
ncbi:Short-chain dehydrogenase TIC 32, chloroplastic [Orchesella cincta]|uniref:Short-chain dehydrogenase TIC 32, chloroplastic n=1 Tax=Orchesella cincta TaxID=48709 RepID=A0A1D2MEG0_ORCCI|nr:Short-chain dehydrogenase TIC 32, chloroplastic [Orchesella cincta]